ncbi:MAG: prepilin-type N-terminal cleavage/methylation domain-containing protein [Lentisphaerae bacterium]|nr:prepilin-type N-terminal cleavage/methylation domain-containing protein [Lentisphaerota bacterium]
MKTKNKESEGTANEANIHVLHVVGRSLLFPFRRPSSVVPASPRRLRRASCRPPSGFTLVELIVVVAIIALLIGLLIPNIQTAREKAWSSNCQNNLRQFGIAVNQYAIDSGGYFNYAGAASRTHIGAQATLAEVRPDVGTKDLTPYYGVAGQGGISGGGSSYTVGNALSYVPGGVTLESLADGQAAARVCPVVLRHIVKDGNFFDPQSSNFKGLRDVPDALDPSVIYTQADFEGSWIWDVTDSTNPVGEEAANTNEDAYDPGGTLILSGSFSTYAVNYTRSGQSKVNIPENVVAFIDWNAREGWAAYLGYTAWTFNSPDGSIIQGTPKWTNAWWLTEVGFHHLVDDEYGANYVAMDGHVAWISSNSISTTNF